MGGLKTENFGNDFHSLSRILGHHDLGYINRYLVVCETGRIQAALIAMIYRVKLHAESSEKAESTIRELKQNMIFGQRHRRILNGLS